MNLKYINFVFVAWISKSKWYCLKKIILSYQIRMLFKYEMHLKNVRFFFLLEIPQSSFFHIDKIKTSHWIIPSLDYSTIEPHSSCKSDHLDLDNIYSSYWSFPINTQKISFNRTDNINCTVEGSSSNKRRTLYENIRIWNSQIVKAKMSGFFVVAKYCFMTK